MLESLSVYLMRNLQNNIEKIRQIFTFFYFFYLNVVITILIILLVPFPMKEISLQLYSYFNDNLQLNNILAILYNQKLAYDVFENFIIAISLIFCLGIKVDQYDIASFSWNKFLISFILPPTFIKILIFFDADTYFFNFAYVNQEEIRKFVPQLINYIDYIFPLKAFIYSVPFIANQYIGIFSQVIGIKSFVLEFLHKLYYMDFVLFGFILLSYIIHIVRRKK